LQRWLFFRVKKHKLQIFTEDHIDNRKNQSKHNKQRMINKLTLLVELIQQSQLPDQSPT
jgi:hypothetical protein